MLLNCIVGEDSWEFLGLQGIKPVNPKGNQSWIFIGRTDAVAETLNLWPPDAKNWLIWKDPDAGKDQRQEEKGTTEDEMVGWHHQLNGHESDQALGVGDGQGSLEYFSPWGLKWWGLNEWFFQGVSHKIIETAKGKSWCLVHLRFPNFVIIVVTV